MQQFHDSHPSDPSCSRGKSKKPRRTRRRLIFALLLLGLFTGQVSIAVEVQRGTCPAADKSLNSWPTPDPWSGGRCFTAEVPGAGWWWIEVTVSVGSPNGPSPESPRLLDARFEWLFLVEEAGAYRLCLDDLPAGGRVTVSSVLLSDAQKAGDPDEIEIELDPLGTLAKLVDAGRIVPVAVDLSPCGEPPMIGEAPTT